MFGWDTSDNGPRAPDEDGRSFISAISEIITDSSETCDGNAKSNMGEARMDIEDSEIAYLGFQDGESYGLTWKVGRGGDFTTFVKHYVVSAVYRMYRVLHCGYTAGNRCSCGQFHGLV